MFLRRLEASSGPGTKGVPTYKQRGRGLGPCLLWGGFDKSRLISSSHRIGDTRLTYFHMTVDHKSPKAHAA